MARPTGFGSQQHLLSQDFVARHARAGHHHDESYVRIAGGHHRCNKPAFAVADQADLMGIDLGPGLEVRHSGFGISRKVRSGNVGHAPGGLAYATVVHAEHNNAFTSQVIRKHEKRFVAEQGFVTIMSSRSGNQEHRGKWAFPWWNRQSARERDPLGLLVVVRDVLFAVRIRLNRVLRPATLQLRHILNALDYQWQMAGAPCVRPINCRQVWTDLALVGGAFLLQLNLEGWAIPRDPRCRYSTHSLVGAIHGCRQAIRRIEDVENQPQLDTTEFYRTQPGAINVGRRGGLGLGLCLYLGALEIKVRVSATLRPGTENLGRIRVELAFIRGLEPIHGQFQLRIRERDGIDDQAEGALVNAVYGGLEVPIVVLGDVQDEMKLCLAGIERALPVARNVLGARNADRR